VARGKELEMGEKKQSATASTRLRSIDALRGFDMFWIIGGDALVTAWANWTEWPNRAKITEQLEHVPWEGFHFYDLIFPLFLFIVGVVIPFSLDKHWQIGESRAALYGRIARRTLLLFALGLLCNNVLQFHWENLRIAGVLQRIALCYGCAALIVLHTRVRGQALAVTCILLGYWALLAFVPAPGSTAGDYSIAGNLPGYIDRHYLPGKIMQEYYGYGDNEGILSTLPAVATTLLGALAGHWLRSGARAILKVLGLVLAGILSLALGTLWSEWFPIIKNLWTSSYVLVAGGWSLLLLALFYGIIDVLGFWRWSFFFMVIGANAITIYVVPRFVDYGTISTFFLGGLARELGTFGPVALLIGVIAFKWLFLLYLYSQRLFLRV
jgi:predicted acyltransferase